MSPVNKKALSETDIISKFIMPAINYIYLYQVFNENQKIVGKVDKLMALCDLLKAKLNQAQTTQMHLADGDC